MIDKLNLWDNIPCEGSINLIAIWNWIIGRKRKKFKEWLADNRKRRRENLHYKEPTLTEAELYDEMK